MLLTGLGDAAETARHFTVFNWMLDISLLLLLASILPRQENPQLGTTPR